jgi:cobalt-zinc-cadmium efflux system membrane fusion protein
MTPMKNKSTREIAPVECPVKFKLALAYVLYVAATIVAVTGCTAKNGDDAQAASVTATDLALTADQQKNVHLYTVARSTFGNTVETSGTVDFDNDHATSVLAPFSGPVSRLLVSLGQNVRKGDPLAVVDSPDFAAAISAYGKAVATATNTRRLAAADKDLVAHDGVAAREAQQAETDAINADADRAAALQAARSLGVDPRTLKGIQAGHSISRVGAIIRSPITGTVVEKLITPGQLLQAGATPCFTVADLSKVWVMAQISGSDLDAVHVGDAADVLIDGASDSIPGTVTNISALVDPATRAVVARVVVDNHGDVLKKQMYVRVVIHSRQQGTGMLVPASVVLRDDENLPFVYVAQPGGHFARQHVELGARTGDEYVVASGLKPGDRIVIDGGIFLQFMQNQ